MRRLGHAEHAGEIRNAYGKHGKYEGKKSLGISRHRWKNSIKMYLNKEDVIV
jgi:hypothetical protein